MIVDDLGDGFLLTAQTDRRIDPNRMTLYLQTAVQSLVEALERAPETPALELSILPESERRQLFEQFNATRTADPQVKLIHELFEGQVRFNPDATAVVYEGKSLTYAELNKRANQLAWYLRGRGVGPDQLVGICVERSLEMVVGLLGIIKAGGAYVPLDPAYPRERLQYMLKDAAPKVLLIQERLRRRVADTAAEVIALDNDWSDIGKSIASNLALRPLGLSSDALAYVIYTSGSTGEPKGVMVEHRNVTRLFTATEQWFRFNERDVWTLFHSVAFDFSVWELWGSLLYGGRLVVVPYITARSPHDFYRLLCDEGVTVLNQTPSAFAQLVEAQAQSAEKQHSLRVVIFGGEALELSTLRPWVERNGAERPQLVNMYGITETTVHVTYRPLIREEIESERSSPIGRPIPDLRVYLLDPRRQPVPIGVTGEIYVGGAGVARGYLNRPELTAERFIEDPFSTDPQERLYKTGDLGRYRADGTLEYLGRNDNQVKIRGYRIELGEIEAALLEHPSVKQAVVLAREDEPGEKRLVAYVVGDRKAALEAPFNNDPQMLFIPQLRKYVKDRLPEYMVPSTWMVVEQLPITANGKLDRRALPAPQSRPEEMGEYSAPRTPLEKSIADIWMQLLPVDRVGLQDNFFELGGHSLLATRVISRIRALVRVELPMLTLFQAPRLEQFAARVEGERSARDAQEELWMSSLARDIRRNIGGMRDDEVIAQIAEIQKEGGPTHG
jgi:amino acid adenylation domain-containing protein